ncbi:FapA family protein [Paenibacillus bovis]|nr:FapA family protein [Paenibacillus bovis]
MERSVISKGKTVEQAVDRALALLEVSKKEVSIEIIDNESRGFLGLNARPAVVRVSLLAASVAEMGALSSMNLHTATPVSVDRHTVGILEQGMSAESAAVVTLPPVDLYADLTLGSNKLEEGKIWIADGQIAMHIPDGANLPMIDAFKSGDILINGTALLAGQSAAVSKEDVIEIRLNGESKDSTWELDIDAEGMNAALHIEPGYHITRSLMDTEPNTRLMLRVVQNKKPAAIDPEEIYHQLRTKEIIFGIDSSMIKQACRAERSGPFIIAAGQLPVAGQDGIFQLQTDAAARKVQPKLRDNGTIDYRETREFPSILEGELIGTVIPSKPGIDGRDIYGKVILAPAVHDIQMIPGKDVQLSEDGRNAFALKSGMPSQTRQGHYVKLSMIPKLMHSGDVNLSTGNIHFRGDVEISGAVQDTMEVEAEGNIRVRGNINMAQILAGDSLIVHANVLSSRIIVGQLQLFYGQIAPMLIYVREQVELMKQAVHQVSSASAFKINDMNQTGLAPLFQVLFQGRFKWMLEQLERLLRLEEQYKTALKEEWIRYFQEIRNGFMNKENSSFRTAEDLESFIRRTNYLYTLASAPVVERNFARLHFVQNSTVRCGGDVVVEKGAYNAHLYCEGVLEATGTLRGGTYYAAEGMVLQEAGSPGTGTTKLHVNATARIKAARVLAGTTIQIGERIHQCMEDVEHVTIRLDNNEQIIWKGSE